MSEMMQVNQTSSGHGTSFWKLGISAVKVLHGQLAASQAICSAVQGLSWTQHCSEQGIS